MSLTIHYNQSLRSYHTFGVEVSAAQWAEAGSIADWQAVVAHLQSHAALPFLVLGGGSNLLFTKDFAGLVIKNNLSGIQVVREDAQWAWVQAAGGENWHELVLWAVERGYGGIENLSLIPGTVGAAPIQNIGAYGTELKDIFEELEAMNLKTAEIQRFSLDDCRFGYRDSVFKNELKGQYLITSVTLRLAKNPIPNLSYSEVADVFARKGITTPSLRDISNAIVGIRQQKLPNPQELGNAGSFFKNPIISKRHFQALKDEFPSISGHFVSETQVKISAAWLIEQAGWKGKRVGDAGVSPRHALILVNYGGASGDDIRNLAFDILDSVRQKFNIVIVPEVNMV